MEYFKINGTDLSKYVNELRVIRTYNYNSQTNANGDTVIDLINSKRVIEVGFIPLSGDNMLTVQRLISAFNVPVSFRNPQTNSIEENVNCIVPENEVEYYTIQQNKVLYKAFTLQFVEL